MNWVYWALTGPLASARSNASILRMMLSRTSSMVGSPREAPAAPPYSANTRNPCFCTTLSSLSAAPLGFLVPASHFSTVLSLVFR